MIHDGKGEDVKGIKYRGCGLVSIELCQVISKTFLLLLCDMDKRIFRRCHLADFRRGRIIGQFKKVGVRIVAEEFCITHRIFSQAWTAFQTIETAVRAISSSLPWAATIAQDHYVVVQVKRNRRRIAGEIVRHMKQTAGCQTSHFIAARSLHKCGLYARRPVRCVPLVPAHRRRGLLWCKEHENWTQQELARFLFTYKSRYNMMSYSGCIHI